MPAVLSDNLIGDLIKEEILGSADQKLNALFDETMESAVQSIVAPINNAIDKAVTQVNGALISGGAELQQFVEAALSQAIEQAKVAINRKILGKIETALDPVLSKLRAVADINITENFATFENFQVSALTIGGANIRAFFGIGEYDFEADLSSQDVLGFFIDDLTFGMGIFTPTAGGSGLKFTSLKLYAEAFGFTLGSDLNDLLSLTGRNIDVALNIGRDLTIAKPVIDFVKSFPGESDKPAGLAVATPAVSANPFIWILTAG